ncbi:MAG: chemotaxis protein CheW [Rhodospirillales bacterium]
MTTQATQIDWTAVRRKLQRNQQALARAMSMDPERVEALFRERAQKLMERHLDREPDVAAETVLVFAEGREKYAIDVTTVAEVLPFLSATPLPEASPEVLGLVNLRGEFLTVINLARLLGTQQENDGRGGFLLVLRGDDARLGLRVDAVERIQSLRLDNLSPPPRGADRATGDGAVYIKGISTEETLIVIDGSAIVSDFLNTGDS